MSRGFSPAPASTPTDSAERDGISSLVLHTSGTLSYWVALDGTLARLSDAWDTFAVENNAPELVATRVVGRSLWDFVHDTTTRNLYARMIAGVRVGRTYRFPLRCDAPQFRRRLEMSLEPD